MTKQGLTLLIITAALRDCPNHILRLSMINRLADRGCLPMRFINGLGSFFVFTVTGMDFHYQDEGDKWFVKPAISQYATMKQQPLELMK
jgi:hypothetical protein